MRTITRKPTLPPYQCNHCEKIWYGAVHQRSFIPEGRKLCLNCWSRLDTYLYQHFREQYNLSWFFMKPENIPFIHHQAQQWIDDKHQKPLRPRDIYRGGGIPHWIRLALEQGMMIPNTTTVYTVTTDEDGYPLHVEESQDRSVLRKIKIPMW